MQRAAPVRFESWVLMTHGSPPQLERPGTYRCMSVPTWEAPARSEATDPWSRTRAHSLRRRTAGGQHPAHGSHCDSWRCGSGVCPLPRSSQVRASSTGHVADREARVGATTARGLTGFCRGVDGAHARKVPLSAPTHTLKRNLDGLNCCSREITKLACDLQKHRIVMMVDNGRPGTTTDILRADCGQRQFLQATPSPRPESIWHHRSPSRN